MDTLINLTFKYGKSHLQRQNIHFILRTLKPKVLIATSI